ncbi:hypothetical protein SAY86_023724 [Trapa natans]|uniref:Uncharacterized protein n=1 Tax=Trapa natans TaxID=22666 RepID=A0AAN7LXT7_TRANT|nr:hypothetical protein SAY86_023724 [Trapa natans]
MRKFQVLTMLFSSCFHVNLKGLVEHNKPNFIPPTSGMINYVLLKFGNLSYSNEFRYGSIVLFNVLEHEVDGYLKIVEAHSAGFLPEIRKEHCLMHLISFG